MEYPIVYIEWLDSFGTWSWAPLELGQGVRPTKCMSVGFLIKDEEGFVTLATSFQTGDEEAVNGTITIPTGAITYRTHLSSGQENEARGWTIDNESA